MGTIRSLGFKRKLLDKELALQLYNEGRCDREIAADCGVAERTVGDWRRKMKLPSHPDPRKKEEASSPHRSTLSQDALEARKRGMTYGQYKVMQEKRGTRRW